MNFYKLNRIRNVFMSDNKMNDFIVKVNPESQVLLSAPHAVSQVRLGKTKVAEIGSTNTVLWLNYLTNANMIIKTKNNYDDVNFDDSSDYKNQIDNLIKNVNIQYLLDFHGLASSRNCDVNLGTNFGKNVSKNEKLFDKLLKNLQDNGFICSIDQPFSGGVKTIAGSQKIKNCNLWTIQVEVNSNITNIPQNFQKFKKLIKIFEDFILSIDKRNNN